MCCRSTSARRSACANPARRSPCITGRKIGVGRQVVAVVNFPPKQIGPLMSECLVTGFHDGDGAVALCVPGREVPLGTRLL